VIELGAAEREVLLALADDEHLMGQRHTEWIGVAPFIEEDLAFASIGQDELGHAAMLYELLADDSDADALAFHRDPADYRSCRLVEAACTDWADAVVRHFLYDEAELLRWQALAASSVEALRGIAERALSEEVYHRRHAHALLDALADDPGAQERLRTAFTELLPLALALFSATDGHAAADPAIVGVALPALLAPWTAAVSTRFGELPAGVAPVSDGGRTARGAEFAEMYARMREVLMLDPTAHW